MDFKPLPEPKPGGPALPLSARWMARISRMFNALLRMEVKRGSGDSVHWSDGRLVLSLKNWAEGGRAAIAVEEEDGSPAVANVNTIKVTNGKLTDNGDGSVSVDLSGGGSSIVWGVLQANHTTTNNYVSVKLAGYDEATNAFTVTGAAFNAALPPMHQTGTTTYRATAFKPSSSHGDAVAVLWPTYDSGDAVLMTQPEGGTGVEVSDVDLDYMILPNKRAWCFEIPICTASGTYYSIIPAWSMTTSSNASFNPVD